MNAFAPYRLEPLAGCLDPAGAGLSFRHYARLTFVTGLRRFFAFRGASPRGLAEWNARIIQTQLADRATVASPRQVRERATVLLL